MTMSLNYCDKVVSGCADKNNKKSSGDILPVVKLVSLCKDV